MHVLLSWFPHICSVMNMTVTTSCNIAIIVVIKQHLSIVLRWWFKYAMIDEVDVWFDWFYKSFRVKRTRILVASEQSPIPFSFSPPLASYFWWGPQWAYHLSFIFHPPFSFLINRIDAKITEYQQKVVLAVHDGWIGANSSSYNTWTFPNSLLYSLTVITTIGMLSAQIVRHHRKCADCAHINLFSYIHFSWFLLIMMVMNWWWWWWCWLQKWPGYGNITPRTGLGKSMTIFYAIVGMPLFLLYLSNIGDIMAKSFKWIYAKVCLCRICPGVAKRRETRTRRKIRALERQINNEYYDENVCIHSFNIVTVSTPKGRFLYIKFCSTNWLDQFAQEDYESCEDSVTQTSSSSSHKSGCDQNHARIEPNDITSTSSSESSHDNELNRVSVPISVCLTIMIR